MKEIVTLDISDIDFSSRPGSSSASVMALRLYARIREAVTPSVVTGRDDIVKEILETRSVASDDIPAALEAKGALNTATATSMQVTIDDDDADDARRAARRAKVAQALYELDRSGSRSVDEVIEHLTSCRLLATEPDDTFARILFDRHGHQWEHDEGDCYVHEPEDWNEPPSILRYDQIERLHGPLTSARPSAR